MTAPLTWLIDTNVISEMMRSRPESRVTAFLDSIVDDGLGRSAVTVWKILDGESDGLIRTDDGRILSTGFGIFLTNYLKTVSLRGLWQMHRRAPISWKISAVRVSPLTITYRMPFLRPLQSCMT